MENDAVTGVNLTNMATDAVNWEGLEPVPSKYSYSSILITAVFFQVVNKIVIIKGAPKSVKCDFWKWKNLYISWIHAIIVSIWDIVCFVLYYPQMFQDLVAYHNPSIYGIVAFSAGYFTYDFVDIVINKKAKAMWEVLVHHVIVAGMFCYNLVANHCLAYNVIVLTAEYNSVFLHSRKLLQLLQVEYSSWLYIINKWINLLTFFVFRFGVLIAITLGMYYWRKRVDAPYYVLLCASMVVMTVINVILFIRLLKSDVIRKRNLRQKEGDEAERKNDHIMNGNGIVPAANNNVAKKVA